MNLTKLTSLNLIHKARRATITTPELRVKFLNNLRLIVSRRCSINPKTGNLLVSDYDLLDATVEELREALLETLKK